jgi:hypothetical protein
MKLVAILKGKYIDKLTALVNTIIRFGFHKYVEFLDYMKD